MTSPPLERLAVLPQPSGAREPHQVKRPADDEVRDHLEHPERPVPDGLVDDGVGRLALAVRAQSHLVPRVRDVALAVDGVVRATVVLRVGVLPREVGNEQRLVHDEAPRVVEGLAGGEGAVAALVREDPVSGQDAPHPEGVYVPSREPLEGVEGEEVRGEVGGQSRVRGVDAPGGQQRIPNDEVHGMEVRSVEAFLGYDGLYLALGREGGGVRVQGVVRAHPVAVLIRRLDDLGGARHDG